MYGVTQVFQVFLEVINYLLLNTDILLYSLQGSMIEKYLSKNIDPDLTLCEVSFYFTLQ
jgi:hypothetical protein